LQKQRAKSGPGGTGSGPQSSVPPQRSEINPNVRPSIAQVVGALGLAQVRLEQFNERLPLLLSDGVLLEQAINGALDAVNAVVAGLPSPLALGLHEGENSRVDRHGAILRTTRAHDQETEARYY